MNNHAAYQGGIQSEREVIKFLRAIPSSRQENIELDIDYRYEGKTVSLKTQHIAERTGNIALELSVTLASGKQIHSWYVTGKAEVYHVRVANDLYSMTKADLQDYVFEHGFDSKKGLSYNTRMSQEAIGHSHTDAVVGLIKLDKLIKHNIITKIGTLS